MAFWFAPALVALRGDEPIAAMKASFDACLRNMWPMLVYSLLGLVFAIVASIPFALGWLVLAPGVRGQRLRELQGHLRRGAVKPGSAARLARQPSPSMRLFPVRPGADVDDERNGERGDARHPQRKLAPHARQLGLRNLEHQLVVNLQHELRRQLLASGSSRAPRSSRA